MISAASIAPTSFSTPLPVLFVSHGAPTFATEPGQSGPALRAYGRALRQRHAIKGIIIMSPHWMSRGLSIMGHPHPETWHDFGGFPAALYQLQYPAPGFPELALTVQRQLATHGLDATIDPQRPLDHGAWVPLMHLFPEADIPAIQVSLPYGWSPEQVMQVGQALSSLASEGILIIGSGSMTHNLSEFFGGQRQPDPYVDAFSRWVEHALVTRNDTALLEYEWEAPHAKRAHPSDDHFLPLFFAYGASGKQSRAHYLTREVMHSILAMDSVAFEP